MKTALGWTILSAVLALSCAQALAQSADSEIETVMVTAQRRETSIQDVPFSIMALNGEEMARERVLNPNDLLAKVPGAYFMSNANKNGNFFGLRGYMTLLQVPGADTPVAFFVDDVYYASPQNLALDLFDMAGAEVLRGPQGTLFGRNVLDGAVVLTTRRPEFREDYGVTAGAGNYGLVDVNGYLNEELIPGQLAGRLSFNYRHHDGYFRNEVDPNQAIDEENIGSLRGQLLFTPREGLKILFSADYTTDSGTNNASKLIGPQPSLDPPLSPDPFTVDFDTPTPYKRHLAGGQVRVDWDVLDGTFTSITAYRWGKVFAARDVDSGPHPFFTSEGYGDDSQFTQEFRFASDPKRAFSYIVGAFYMHDNNFGGGTNVENVDPASVFYLYVPNYSRYTGEQSVLTSSYAVFADATYNITDTLTAEAGIRYTYDDKLGYSHVHGDGNPNVTVFGDPADLLHVGPYFVRFRHNWGAFTPRFTIRYQAWPEANFYGTISRGFQGGGFSSQNTTILTLGTPFAPEYATNYEVGVKSLLFSGKVLLNADLFRQDTSDLQVQSYNQFVQAIISNAGAARQQGLELESAWKVTDALQLNLNYAYLDAHYTKFPATPTHGDYSGHPLPYAAKHSLTVGAQYTLDLADQGAFTLAADYSFRSKLSLDDCDCFPDTVTNKSRWNLLNGNITYDSPNGKWSVSLWGKNLLNAATVQTAFDLTVFSYTVAEYAAGERGYYAYYMNPRTVGVSLSFKH